jgi:hypothetical protein
MVSQPRRSPCGWDIEARRSAAAVLAKLGMAVNLLGRHGGASTVLEMDAAAEARTQDLRIKRCPFAGLLSLSTGIWVRCGRLSLPQICEVRDPPFRAALLAGWAAHGGTDVDAAARDSTGRGRPPRKQPWHRPLARSPSGSAALTVARSASSSWPPASARSGTRQRAS